MTLEEKAEDSFEQYRTKDIDYVVSPYSEDNGTKKLMFNNEYDAEEEYFRFYKQGYLAGTKELEEENILLKTKLDALSDGVDWKCILGKNEQIEELQALVEKMQDVLGV